MQDQDLIRMANQIAKAFNAYGDDEAIAQTQDHIRRFWEPRMRKQIRAYVSDGGKGLDPVALKAIQRLTEAALAAGAPSG